MPLISCVMAKTIVVAPSSLQTSRKLYSTAKRKLKRIATPAAFHNRTWCKFKSVEMLVIHLRKRPEIASRNLVQPHVHVGAIKV